MTNSTEKTKEPLSLLAPLSKAVQGGPTGFDPEMCYSWAHGIF